jgi:SNF2 family DNA or RNA helicase
VDFLVRRGRALLGSEPGTGKTWTSLVAARWRVPAGDLLILCPKVAVGVWEEHVRAVLGETATLYAGPPRRRRALALAGAGCVVAPYSLALEIATRRPTWPLVICDEAHWLRNRQARTLYQAVRRLRSRDLFLLTGTPVVNRGDDVWALLNLLDPERFPSYWRFVLQHFAVARMPWGAVTVGAPRAPAALRALLEEYMIRHTRAMVLRDLGPLVRQRLPVALTPYQARVYRQLAEEMLAEVGEGAFVLTPTRVAQLVRLRQVLVTPALIGGEHSSGGFALLADALANEFQQGRACIVFTPFVRALPYVQALAQRLGAASWVVHGGQSAVQLAAAVRAFEAAPGPRKVLGCSIRSSASWTAVSAQTAFFLGYDWVPAVNWQAEGRLHRHGQTGAVLAAYLVHRGTIDEHVLRVLQRKTSWEQLLLRPRALVLPEEERP